MKNYFLSILCLFILSAQAQTYTPSKENLKARTSFQDNKFGMFIHWGASSVLGDGEWVMDNKGINKDCFYKNVTRFRFDAVFCTKLILKETCYLY